uniref:RRM domain-containing protein n=1 Tax=Panagrolaimus sp. JU765 TaxID=591449 RepID=A0AC34QN45_9BILA
MKRGYDNFGGSSGGYRGGGHSGSGPYPPGFKKYRRDDVDPVNPTPSKVLHIRNLTAETTEADLLNALSHFGNVAYTTLMANGHMALAEFSTMDEARACIAYSKNHQIMVRNHPVLINYSTSEKIQRAGLEGEEPNKVIVLTISNVTYPITVDILKEICGEHGKVNRIALIKRPGVLQALVEFDTAEEATKAKYGLNGADIYDNACTLKVEYGKMDTVKVTANNADQWDYTCDPALKPENQVENGKEDDEESSWRPQRRHEPDAHFMQPNSYASGGGYFPATTETVRGRGGFRGRGSARGGTYIPDEARQGFFSDRSSGYETGYGPPRGSRGTRGSSRGGTFEPRNDDYGRPSSYGDRGHSRGYERSDRDYDRERDRDHRYSDDRYSEERDRHGSDRHRDDRDRDRGERRHADDRYSSRDEPDRGHSGGVNGSVVMVYGVDAPQFNCDRLFNLLCCYGNCLKIKIMKSKPDTCMIQMATPEQAQNVIEHLQNLTIFKSRLTFRPSIQNVVHDVAEPHMLLDGTPGFKDYLSSTVHRFGTSEVTALTKIVYPSDELYWDQSPILLNEEVLKKLFSQKGAPLPIRVTIHQFNGNCTGILKFPNEREASEALMLCNNMVIAGGPQTIPFVFKLAYATPEHKRN